MCGLGLWQPIGRALCRSPSAVPFDGLRDMCRLGLWQPIGRALLSKPIGRAL
jgi:hypothetical protein